MSNLANLTQYRDNWPTRVPAPPFLQGPNGQRYMYTLQLCTDLLLEKMNQGIKIRFPGEGDPSQIPWLANDRVLVQGPAEPNANFIARLQVAFQTWKKSGSRLSVLEQIQAYLQGLQPGVVATLPEVAIVGGSYPTVATWDVLYQNTPLGAPPAKTTVMPSNFNWDGKATPWRNWLLLYMALVPVQGLSGSSAQTGTAAGGSFTVPGHNVGGVWVPTTSGTPINSPWLTVTGLAGLAAAQVGQWLTLSGSTNPGNNGTFPIVSVPSSTSCVIANPNGVASDTGPLTWSVGEYPFIGPALPWGNYNYTGRTIGQGQLVTAPVDTGANVGGVWQPTTTPTYLPTQSWGLNVSSLVIQTIRSLLRDPSGLKGWKSAGTYYPDIVVLFDGGDGTAGNAFSPLSSPGSGNPDGTFGGHGKLVGGVWVPNRLISSPYDCYAQGTGQWKACSVPNVT